MKSRKVERKKECTIFTGILDKIFSHTSFFSYLIKLVLPPVRATKSGTVKKCGSGMLTTTVVENISDDLLEFDQVLENCVEKELKFYR